MLTLVVVLSIGQVFPELTPIDSEQTESVFVYQDDLKHDYIESFIDEQTISYSKELHDSSQNTFVLYELNPAGYAIYALRDDAQAFIEGSKTSNSPYFEHLDDDCYYFGVGNYYYREGLDLINIFDESDRISIEEESSNDLVLSDSLFTISEDEEIDLLATSFPSNPDPDLTTTYNGFTVIKDYEYFSTLINYPANVNGTCGLVALSMMISYLDEFKNPDYIPAKYEKDFKANNGTITAFADFLFENYLHTFWGFGSAAKGYPMANGEVKDTMQDYLKGECFGGDTYLYDHTECPNGCIFNTHKTPRKYINGGCPAIITMTSYNTTYREEDLHLTYHTVVAYGYNKNDDTFLVNLGWDPFSYASCEIIVSSATIYSFNTFVYTGD